MKAPDHPVPSGDREIARLFLAALAASGREVAVVSRLRVHDRVGDPARQAALARAAEAEVARLGPLLAADPPALWFTYHCYHRAPDLIGPPLARALSIPYVIAEPSFSPRRAEGPWAGFHAAARAAILAADRLLVTKPRDLPALSRLAAPGRIVALPPFVDPGPEPAAPAPSSALRLLAVAMMRPGDKLASYAALAEALRRLALPFTLTVAGEGPERAAVEALFAGLPVRFLGLVEGPALRALYEAHDLLVWPGIGEGIGLVYLEAMAAGCPALAAGHPGPAAVLPGPLPPPGDPAAFAAAIPATARAPGARAAARAHVLARHGIAAGAARLDAILGGLGA